MLTILFLLAIAAAAGLTGFNPSRRGHGFALPIEIQRERELLAARKAAEMDESKPSGVPSLPPAPFSAPVLGAPAFANRVVVCLLPNK